MPIYTHTSHTHIHTHITRTHTQNGKLTRESALAIAEKLGLITSAKIDRTSSITKSTQLFNFSVYKWSKGRTVQRLILQVSPQLRQVHNTRNRWCDMVARLSQEWNSSLFLRKTAWQPPQSDAFACIVNPPLTHFNSLCAYVHYTTQLRYKVKL